MLSPELRQQIEQESEHYANVEYSEKAKHIWHLDSQKWDNAQESWNHGATTYALKWQEAEQRVERYEKALKEIAMQRTCAETEADEEIPIGSDGTRLGDIEMGYDCCITTAREALTPKPTTNE